MAHTREKVESIFKKFGSVRHLATIIGSDYQNVYNWLNRGRIPVRHWDVIIDKSKNYGIKLTIKDFI